jgi:hypothetical protein
MKTEEEEQAPSTDSESETEESLSSSESEHGQVDHIHCRLDNLLEATLHDFPRSHIVLSAHLQLDHLCSTTLWSLVLRALKECGPEAHQSSQGDKKSYMRLNKNKPFPQSTWVASIERLLARLDCIFADLIKSEGTRSHSDTLPAEEQRAFRACLQIWKKSYRGRLVICRDSVQNSHHRVITALEASVLCRRDEAVRLVLCVSDDSMDLIQLKEDLIRTADLTKDDRRWKSLEICADRSLQAQGALQLVCYQSVHFPSFIISRHQARQSNVLTERRAKATLHERQVCSISTANNLQRQLQLLLQHISPRRRGSEDI